MRTTAISINDDRYRQVNLWLVCLLSCLLTLTPVLSFGQDSDSESLDYVGKAISVSGEVLVLETDGDTRRLQRRSDVFIGDTLFTNGNSFVQLRMVDGAIIRLNEFTEFAIVDYRWEEDPDNDSVVLDLLRGGFRTITGAVDKNAYSAQVGLHSFIGIRGTEYEAVVTPEGEVFTGVYDGGITLSNTVGSLDLGLNANYDFGRVVDDVTPPEGLINEPNEIGDLIFETVVAADEEEEQGGNSTAIASNNGSNDDDNADTPAVAGAANTDNDDGDDGTALANSLAPGNADGQPASVASNTDNAGAINANDIPVDGPVSGTDPGTNNGPNLAPPDSHLIASVDLTTQGTINPDNTAVSDTNDLRTNLNETSGDGATNIISTVTDTNQDDGLLDDLSSTGSTTNIASLTSDSSATDATDTVPTDDDLPTSSSVDNDGTDVGADPISVDPPATTDDDSGGTTDSNEPPADDPPPASDDGSTTGSDDPPPASDDDDGSTTGSNDPPPDDPPPVSDDDDGSTTGSNDPPPDDGTTDPPPPPPEPDFEIVWGEWNVPQTVFGVNTENLADGRIRIATSESFAELTPTPVSQLTGSFSYGSNAEVHGHGSAGSINNLTANMDVNFDSGSISNGNLDLTVGGQQNWTVDFNGNVAAGNVFLNPTNATLFEGGSLISNAIEASLGGAFTGPTGEVFVGGFELLDLLNLDNTVQGVYAIQR